MLRNFKDLYGFEIHADDGHFGVVNDFYLDDKTWRLQFVVVDTGDWLPDRRILIPFSTLDKPDWVKRVIPIRHTREDVVRRFVRGVIGRYAPFG